MPYGSHLWPVSSVERVTSSFSQTKLSTLPSGDRNHLKFENLMDLLDKKAKVSACAKSYEEIIEFLRLLRYNSAVPREEERWYWKDVGRGTKSASDASMVNAHNLEWLNSLNQVIELLEATLIELQHNEDQSGDWKDWGKQLAALASITAEVLCCRCYEAE